MKQAKILFFTLILSQFLFAKEFLVDNQNSKAEFSIEYKKTTLISGNFKNIGGTIFLDDTQNDIASLKGFVEVNSVSTGNNNLNSLISSEKILNAKKYPKIEFIADKVDDSKVYGNISINGVQRSVDFDIESSGVFLDKLYITMTTTLKRNSFDLAWDVLEEQGSSQASNDIKIKIYIKADIINDIKFQYAREKKVKK